MFPHISDSAFSNNLINDAVFQSFLGCHEVIPFAVPFHFFHRFAGVCCQDRIQALLDLQDLLGLNLNVRALSPAAAGGLVNHDFTVGKRNTLSFCS